MKTTTTLLMTSMSFAFLMCGMTLWADPVGTVFTYQGRLLDGNVAADGLYDFQFKLFDDPNMVVGIQIGSTLNEDAVPVLDGYFVAELDFGSDPNVFNSDARWLQIAVRPGAETGNYTSLSPLQPLSPIPYALYAAVSNWNNLANIPAGFADGVDNTGISVETDPTVLASVKDGVDWSEVSGIPAGFADGVDNTGLAFETDPTVLASVKDGIDWSELSGIPAGFGDNVDDIGITVESDPTVLASVKDGIDWSELSGIPAGFSDGVDNVGITSESDPQVGSNATGYVPRWNGSALVSGKIFENTLNVGIGTNTPESTLHVAGGNWNITDGEGDFKIGNSAYRLKIGIATGGGGAGDVLMRAVGGTNRLKLGSGTEDVLTVQNESVDIDGYLKTAGIYEGRYGDTWLPKDSVRNWESVAMSADGTRQTAVADYIYISTDSGNTWTPKDSVHPWSAVAMSTNGAIQTAVMSSGYIYVSTDYGNTWTQKGIAQSWSAVAMSANGAIQTVGGNTGTYIYVSTDYGNTWTAKATSEPRDYRGVATSADGTIQTAVTRLGGIFVSTDSGNTWTSKGYTSEEWTSVAMSTDGTIQIAGADGGYTYISKDSGNTWDPTGPTNMWSVAISADGTKQVAAGHWSANIYISTDSGNSWTQKGFSNDWYDVAMSADGTSLTAVPWGDQIYVSASSFVGIGTTTPTARLEVAGNLKTAAINESSTGNVGIGTASPSEKLEIAGNVKISGSGSENRPNLIIHDSNGSNDRPGIQFTNNAIQYIAGDDSSNEIFSICSQFSSNRSYDAILNIQGKATGNWGKYLSLTHDGTDGIISTDSGDLVLSPNQNVGIGTASPGRKLDVNGVAKATGFNGAPWISPQWVFTNASIGTVGYFPHFVNDSALGAYKYMTPFNVTILGATISGDNETNGSNFSIRLYVNGSLVATTTASAVADQASVNQAFPSPQNVSAGGVIYLECGTGNSLGELVVVLYGRTNE